VLIFLILFIDEFFFFFLRFTDFWCSFFRSSSCSLFSIYFPLVRFIWMFHDSLQNLSFFWSRCLIIFSFHSILISTLIILIIIILFLFIIILIIVLFTLIFFFFFLFHFLHIRFPGILFFTILLFIFFFSFKIIFIIFI